MNKNGVADFYLILSLERAYKSSIFHCQTSNPVNEPQQTRSSLDPLLQELCLFFIKSAYFDKEQRKLNYFEHGKNFAEVITMQFIV